jgi:hypothetical protein
MTDETDRWYHYRLREGVDLARCPEDVVVLSQRSWDQSEADGVSEWMPEPGDGKGPWFMCEYHSPSQLREFFALDRADLSTADRIHRESVVAAVESAARI